MKNEEGIDVSMHLALDLHTGVFMPLLQVRDIPADLYDNLSRVAEAENRSIAQETIVLLKKALNYREERTSRRQKVLDEIKGLHLGNTGAFPDPAQLIREDRDR